MINYLSTYLLLVLLVVNATDSIAQKISVKSGEQIAGFSFMAGSAVNEPVILYQQNIQMLSGIPDRATLSIYGNGQVITHFPDYMKKAGDYEMRLDTAELTDLIQSLSDNGVLDFDEASVKNNLKSYEKTLRVKGKFYEVSDAVVTSIEIRLDEYQKNSLAKIIKGYRKTFRWSNIEHVAKQFKQDIDISNANQSVLGLKSLMEDARLVKMERR